MISEKIRWSLIKAFLVKITFFSFFLWKRQYYVWQEWDLLSRTGYKGKQVLFVGRLAHQTWPKLSKQLPIEQSFKLAQTSKRSVSFDISLSNCDWNTPDLCIFLSFLLPSPPLPHFLAHLLHGSVSSLFLQWIGFQPLSQAWRLLPLISAIFPRLTASFTPHNSPPSPSPHPWLHLLQGRVFCACVCVCNPNSLQPNLNKFCQHQGNLPFHILLSHLLFCLSYFLSPVSNSTPDNMMLEVKKEVAMFFDNISYECCMAHVMNKETSLVHMCGSVVEKSTAVTKELYHTGIRTCRLKHSGPASKCVQPQHRIISLWGLKHRALGKDWHIQTGDFCAFKIRKRKKGQNKLVSLSFVWNVTGL